ncbi:putative lipase ROG1 isoform X2 [Magnolia sinica]|uniref:putative lipase ROG1 isoform X2 n=1 Tax=Magnolia sinica TaxID=86752 RepID=UPI00265A44AC|nr:putative lipase ROG1 isoform X2 [Magnolia sinica]
MASLKPQRSSATAQTESKGLGKSSKKKKKSRFSTIGCFKTSSDTTVEIPDGFHALEMESNVAGDRRLPAHLVVFVNGIIGSAANWKFAAKQFIKLFPEDVIVHCSESNCSMLTLDGVDVMGERLAEEVISVIKRRPELQKISFVGHSLGGLIARYAIGRLYGRNPRTEPFEENGDSNGVECGTEHPEEKSNGKIAGLEPMNFITFATPHLGSRGHRQVPLFCGFHMLEKMATHTSRIIGRTGIHLFLNDNDEGRPPLLLQMVNDNGDLQFMSALQSFRRRVAYSNSCFDHIVGWKTSSIRRQHELPKLQHLSKNDKYPHIVNVEAPKVDSLQQEVLSESEVKTIDLEEAMIRGLNKVSWERVDVSFRKSKQRYFAHSTIQASRCFS